METAVELVDVRKRFETRSGPPVVAVDGVSLDIPRGSLFGILGPNGAGKTTLLRLIHAFWPRTEGRIRVLGLDPDVDGRTLKARLGIAPQENNLDPDFDVRRNLTTYARYFRIPAAEARRRTQSLLEFVGLAEKAHEPVEALSGGMKRRLILARALLNEPDVILLDEPTTGLDPQAKHLVWDKVRALRRQGKTILLTTHYMEEAEQLCDELVIMDHGKILVRGRPPDLVRDHAGKEVIEVAVSDDPSLRKALADLASASGARIDHVPGRSFLYAPDADALRARIRAQLDPAELVVRRATLEDVFLRLTGRDLRE